MDSMARRFSTLFQDLKQRTEKNTEVAVMGSHG